MEAKSKAVQTDVLVRTLITAGFTVTNARRQPMHLEIECERKDSFGMTVPYLITLTDADAPSDAHLASASEIARTDGKVFVPIARYRGDKWLSIDDAMETMGGAVPTWRALGSEYAQWLVTTGKNKLPTGESGEPWQLFELAVADGLEFLFGHRVRRMGGARRGQRVSDLIAQTSDETLLVVDAKASKNQFSVTMAELRPLVEYVKTQKARQQGQVGVTAAVLVAVAFEQTEEALVEVSSQFSAETGVTLSCLLVDTLTQMVEKISSRPVLRNAIIWRRIFSRPGIVKLNSFLSELNAAADQRMPRTSLDAPARR